MKLYLPAAYERSGEASVLGEEAYTDKDKAQTMAEMMVEALPDDFVAVVREVELAPSFIEYGVVTPDGDYTSAVSEDAAQMIASYGRSKGLGSRVCQRDVIAMTGEWE